MRSIRLLFHAVAATDMAMKHGLHLVERARYAVLQLLLMLLCLCLLWIFLLLAPLQVRQGLLGLLQTLDDTLQAGKDPPIDLFGDCPDPWVVHVDREGVSAIGCCCG